MCEDVPVAVLAKFGDTEAPVMKGGGRIYKNTEGQTMLEFTYGAGNGYCWDDDPNKGERSLNANEVQLYRFPVKKELPSVLDPAKSDTWRFAIGEQLDENTDWYIWFHVYIDLLNHYGPAFFDSSPFVFNVEELTTLWQNEGEGNDKS